MQVTADTINLKPPSPGRWTAPLTLALLAHGALMVALTWGVHWQHDPTPVAVEAELWSRLPQQAAPRAVEPPQPPPPPPEPKPAPRPEPRPEPVAKPPPPPAVKQPDIATAQAKKKQEEDPRARERAEKERQAKAEKARADKLKAEQAKKAADEKRQAEQRQKQEQARKAAQAQRDSEATERLREENLRRIMGQANATGGPQSTGTAQRSSGPSAGYGARVAARIKPNVLFTDPISGNPAAEIEVRTLPDGTITGRRLVRSSGNAAWDRAALDAIDRTAALPRDVDGRVPSSLIITMRPQD